jgi:hypothetical protein
MKKTFCVIVVLLGSVLVFKSAGSQKPSLTSPIIVASGSLTHHNGSFEVPMYTPTQDGVFRVSAYPTLTQSDPNSQSTWIYLIVWTDAAGGEADDLFQEQGSGHGNFLNFYSGFQQGAPSVVLQAKAGKPIIHQMSQSGNPDNSAYDLFYVVEQLQ